MGQVEVRTGGTLVVEPGASPARDGGYDVQVQRVGTQVVVRLSGRIDQLAAERLASALDEVESLVITRVVVDLDAVHCVEGAGMDFVVALDERWSLRLLNAPQELRGLMPPRHRPG